MQSARFSDCIVFRFAEASSGQPQVPELQAQGLPGDPQQGAFIARGIAWADKKDYDKAIRDYDETIRLDPAYSLAFYDRGLAWANKKDYDKAIRDYDEAIRLDSKYAMAF